MHILALTQNDIAAPKYGGALRVALLLEQALKQGHTVTAIRFRPAGAPASHASACIPIRDIMIPRGYELAPVAALTHLLSREAERAAFAIHRERPIDLVQSDPPWAALTGARIARRLRIPHVLLAQNCETALAAEFARSGPARRVPLIGRHVSDFNIGVVRWAEKRAISGASLTLTPSIHDREELAALGIAPKGVAILPNGTSVRRSTPNMRVTQRRALGLAPGTPTAIFVGRMDYPPNREALRLICTRIAPACPGVVFLLVGLNPPRISVPPNVRMIGAVESVDPYLAASDLALVPILQGSGTRIKILDAWASGLPVLSTTAGAAGLDYQDGIHLVLEDEIERFPARITELLADPVRLARLRQGSLIAAFPYRWETLGKQYVTSLEALVEGS